MVYFGCFLDDELPDYIMVMVANKKTKEQMTDDLNLFLGNNTEKFTSWSVCIERNCLLTIHEFVIILYF